MATFQTLFNQYIAFKAQVGLGLPESGAGATILRYNGGTQGALSKTAIESKEIRRDAMRTRGRHGFQQTAGGPYLTERSLGSADLITLALLRGSFDTEISLTSGDYTSLAIAAGPPSVITFTSGSPITKGIRVGDVIMITASGTPANNNRNLRVTALTASTITVAELLTTAGADITATMKRRGRKVINPPAGSLVNTYFTIEEYLADIDQSELFTDCFWKTGKWSMAPDGLFMFEPSWVGTGAFVPEPAVSSPVFTSPTTPTGTPLAALDATIRMGSTDLVNLTAFDLTIDNGAVAPQVVGAKVSPTVLPGQNSISMNLTMLRSDLSNLTSYFNETSLSLHVLAVENTAEPKNFISLNVPFFTLGGVSKSAASIAGGAQTETLTVPAALIGADTSGAGFDNTMMSVQISNLT